MMKKTCALLMIPCLGWLGLAGCFSTRPQDGLVSARAMRGESLVFMGEQAAQLAFSPVRPGSVRLRSTYAGSPQTIHYEENRDFTVDYARGQIRRTPASRLPDFRTNLLYGVEDFDHSKFPGFGNNGFFAFANYAVGSRIDWPKQATQTQFLPVTQAKLRQGRTVKIVAFGDSITWGGDATQTNLIFWQRWAAALQQKHPLARVETFNGATGGDTTAQGLARLEEKVLKQKPDLVLLGFGMNDHNVGNYGTPLPQFEANLQTLIDRIRTEAGAEVVLYSTFPPNPKWHFGSHQMAAYAEVTERVARQKNCAFGDVYRNWLVLAEKKKPEDLLANNINHPNDFGHGLYFEILQRLGL